MNPTSLTYDESGNAVLTLPKQEMRQLFSDALVRVADQRQSACNIYQDWSGSSPEVQSCTARYGELAYFVNALHSVQLITTKALGKKDGEK